MATVCDRMDPRDVAGILEDLVELRRLGSAQHHLGFSELCEATRRMPVPARSQGAEIVLRVLDACADL